MFNDIDKITINRIDRLIDKGNNALALYQQSGVALPSYDNNILTRGLGRRQKQEISITSTQNDGFFTEWQSQALSFLIDLLGSEHTYAKNFKESVTSDCRVCVEKGLGILRGLKEDVSKGFLAKFKTLHNVSMRTKEKSQRQQSETGEKTKGGVLMMSVTSSKQNWEAIKSEYGVSKKDFGKKINFVSASFKRKIIFRDVEHAFVLASQGFSKPALILAGGVIEELLRLYLEHNKKIQPKDKCFFDYIKACEDNGLLKKGVSGLATVVRNFRNLVHLPEEKTKTDTISKATAKGAVASIFTIANDFQKTLKEPSRA